MGKEIRSSSKNQQQQGRGLPSHLLDMNLSTDWKDASHKAKNCSNTMETLVPGYVWIVPKFFSKRECQNWITYMEDASSWEYMAQRGTRYLAARECFRTQRNDPNMAHTIFRRMQEYWFHSSSSDEPPLQLGLPPSHPVGCNPNLRLYKYTKGHSFGKHMDESVPIGPGYETKLTALVYLSECQGGATRFDVPPTVPQRNKGTEEAVVAYQPQVGTLLLHLHGNHCLLHQADPVLGGIKYVLRTDVVYKA